MTALSSPFPLPALYFDCVGDSCFVLLQDMAGKLYEHTLEHPRQAAQLLVPTIERICTAAKISLSDLKTAVTVQGPGSFTGVRIGLSGLQGLQWETSCTSYAINQLDLLKGIAFSEANISAGAIIIDAGKKNAFVGLYAATKEPVYQLISGDELVTLRERHGHLPFFMPRQEGVETPSFQIEKTTLFSITPEKIWSFLKNNFAHSHAAWHKNLATPLYLKPPTVTVSSCVKS
ncbi:tRNA (adenosine(37)-N6)-threonylcarbamoyltransferase complex dimerization subunit type 1 TsaB [Alphaproteobacteria bacterium]|nr:tRNA (adenosine(37)-N6)-threonylcarbamoyltransferase complex dimerization subunit type 1 TsaB [Alphaproteobacteria bacterium]